MSGAKPHLFIFCFHTARYRERDKEDSHLRAISKQRWTQPLTPPQGTQHQRIKPTEAEPSLLKLQIYIWPRKHNSRSSHSIFIESSKMHCMMSVLSTSFISSFLCSYIFLPFYWLAGDTPPLETQPQKIKHAWLRKTLPGTWQKRRRVTFLSVYIFYTCLTESPSRTARPDPADPSSFRWQRAVTTNTVNYCHF